MTPPTRRRWSATRTATFTSLAFVIGQLIYVLAYAVSTGQYIVVFSLVLTTPIAALAGALGGGALHWTIAMLNNRRSGRQIGA